MNLTVTVEYKKSCGKRHIFSNFNPLSGDFTVKSGNHKINLGLKTHISGFCQIHFSNKLA